jgi:hypothetical protein
MAGASPFARQLLLDGLRPARHGGLQRDAPAWDGLRQANWTAARDLFAARLEEAPDDPEALDGLGRALWWLGDPQAGIERRREAYAEYRRRGDTLAISSSSNRASQCDLE